MQCDARALGEHTPGMEPVSDRRKRQRAEPADSKEAACCGRGRNIVVTDTNGCSGFGPRRVTDASVTCIYVLYGLLGACTNCTYGKYYYVDD